MEPEVERLILTEMERQSREIASLTAKVDRLMRQDFFRARFIQPKEGVEE
jgi:hypothetical protein